MDSRTSNTKLAKKIKLLHKKIFSWWNTEQRHLPPPFPAKKNRREFPWRKTTDPYHVLVSEFMLQQTQAERVVPKYLEFLKRFPDMETLAKAKQADVIAAWSGLGYNRRAKWLQEAAQYIVKKGNFPDTVEELRKIKGIGPYSSRSILIFAFNEDIGTVDTNIRRIFIDEGFATEKTPKKELFKIADQLVPNGQSRDWHNALMDYGAQVKTVQETGIRPKTSQSKFKGSNRQYRGKIIKYLIKHKQASKTALKKSCNIPKAKIDDILEKLLNEEMIHKKDDIYYL